MKICWDNLENLRYSSGTGKWYRGTRTFIYKEECKVCKEPFLIVSDKKGNFCSNKCFHKNGRSKEHKKNISRSKIIYIGINNPNYGNKWTNDQKKKMSLQKIGHGLGRKRERHSLRMLGRKNPNWQGGLSLIEYCECWRDKEYKKNILERDGNKCLNPLCRGNSTKLCGHHIDYDKKNCTPGNIITVCFSCNARANFNREFWQNHYEKITNQRRITI